VNANDFTNLRKLLEKEAQKRNDEAELILGGADPLQVAKDLDDDRAILLCALFAYGNANAIVKFLKKLDFLLLNSDEVNIQKKAIEFYYRFQSKEDVAQIFLTLSRMEKGELKDTFLQGYLKEESVIDGVFEIIKKFSILNSYDSKGYRFLVGTIPKNGKPSSPYKRWMMFLRWMVRKDALDLGLWDEVSTADLIIPLDTHTFNVSRKLGLLKRKTRDFQAAVELTEKLKEFSPKDPVKYDFALYRIGQEKVMV